MRDHRVAEGQFSAGQQLAEMLLADQAAAGMVIRVVECLNGCLSPCNVSLRGAGRRTLRFSRIEHADVPALLAFAHRYVAEANESELYNGMPARLSAKLTVNAPSPQALITAPAPNAAPAATTSGG